MKPLELSGLKGNHPLAFLAACGALMCSVEGNRDVKLGWKRANDRSGWIAVLFSEGTDDLTLENLIETLILRAANLPDCEALGWSDKIDNRSKFKALGSSVIERATSCDDKSITWLPALSSDIVGNKEKLQPTSLDLTSGSQRFLKSLRSLSADLSRVPRRNGQPVGVAAFREALVGPWLYGDQEHSLGWDPQTQRLHALRHMLPQQDTQNRSVRGAVFLASQALPLFPCFAVHGKLRTTGFHNLNGEDWFAWPIWCEPISVNTLRSLLVQPLNRQLEQRGVKVVYKCLRAHTGGSDGDYRVFGNAEEHPLDR